MLLRLSTGETVEVAKSPFMIGREAGCDLVLADPKASRRHAQLEPLADGRAVLTDLGSANGTFVNGVRIAAPIVLGGGDEVRLADTVIAVVGPVASPVAPGQRATVVAGPPPTAPAAASPPVTPAAGDPGGGLPGGRNRWLAVGAIAVVLAGAGAGIGIALGGKDGDEAAATGLTFGPPTTAASTAVTARPVTTAPITTQPVTTAPVTTAPVTTAPVTTGGDAGAAAVLLAHVPEAIRSTCDAQAAENRLPGDVAAAYCVGSPEIGVYYSLFPDVAALQASYEQAIAVNSGVRDTGDCVADTIAENPYSASGEPAGRYLCVTDGASGFPYIVWTDEALAIRATAFHKGGDRQALYDFWLNEAGPVR